MRKRKIMLVDDDNNVLDSLRRILYKPDYQLIMFDNANNALNYLTQEHGDIDIIISDNKMPGIKGLDFLIEVRQKFPDIIRIMLTGQSDIMDAKIAINEGEVYKFLTKPCDADELKLIIRHALSYRDLWFDNQKLLKHINDQEKIIQSLEKAHPGITKVPTDNYGRVVIDIEKDESLDDFMKKYF